MEIIRVENLCKTYGSGKTRVAALDNLSFQVQKGELIAITGPSGSGKSTLLHLLCGVDTPTSGKILVDGKNIIFKTREESAIFRRRQVGLIYQSYNLIPSLDVEKNLLLPLMLDNRKANRSYLHELTEILGLEKVMHHLPGELSGGQQQRVAIGRALINAPAIVLADEPTGNLDRQAGQSIIELLKMSNRKYKQTVIIVTHDENISSQTGRVLEIVDGKLKTDKAIR